MKEKNGYQLSYGEIVKVGKYELICFEENNGFATAVFKEPVFQSEYGFNNHLFASGILTRLCDELLPELEAALGAENILEFKTDLTAMDGSLKYGSMFSKISLPTFDFYRKHRSVFIKNKIDHYWWLATPDASGMKMRVG